MKLSNGGELPLLDKIRKRLSTRKKAVLAGIGDDAAVLAPDPRKLLASTDMMVEGVHFDPRLITPQQLGFKLVSVNVSDIYAMGGEPSVILVDLAMPGDTEEDFVEALLDGIDEACKHYGVSVVGGDISSTKQWMVFAVTVIGYTEKPSKRSGARPGDGIFVTGTLGDSACGLEVLKRIGRPVDFEKPVSMPLKWSIVEPLLRRHLIPRATRPGKWVKEASALIDISDGLLIDLTRLCAESNTGAKIYAERIPLSMELIPAAIAIGRDPLDFALTGGEDYELLFTSPIKKGIRGATRIGEVTRSGMFLVRKNGTEEPFGPEGYQHFK